MKAFRIIWTVLGHTRYQDYPTRREAEVNQKDIAGFEGVRECRLLEIETDTDPATGMLTSTVGRFKRAPPNAWERLSKGGGL